jgi:AraC-like DNA-binding protein
MTPSPLTYTEFTPGAAVQDLVLTYWSFTVRDLPWEAFEQVVWPDGCLSIAACVLRGEVVAIPLVGPRREPLSAPLEAGMQFWGVRFRPEMGASFLGRPARQLRDQAGPAHHWLGTEPLRALSDALLGTLAHFPPLTTGDDIEHAVTLVLDRWLFDSADDTLPPEPCVRDAVRAIVATEGSQQMAIIADVVSVSPRHLQRCFKEAVGLSPKEYAMIRRGRHALEAAALHENGAAGPARLAAASGYADHAHLVRDFERLMSGTPDKLRRRLATIAVSALMKSDR